MIAAMFYLSLLVLGYTYVLFPFMVYLLATLRPRPYHKQAICPKVSLIVACYNEEAHIEDKLENMLVMNYPRECLEIIVASDGSTDATDRIVQRFSSQAVRLLSLPRRGKQDALNDAVTVSQGEILVFTDSNSHFEPNAIRVLVQPFADPTVGGVSGNQCYLKSGKVEQLAGKGERSYWGFDRWLKKCESEFGNTISATGSIYSIRRSLFQPVPAGVTDDFTISTRVIAQGYRLVFEPEAISWEPVAGSTKREFGRKSRVITRGLRGLLLMSELFNPFRYGLYSWQLFSHKLLRRLMFIPLLLLLLTNILLARENVLFWAAAVIQVFFYLSAVVGWCGDQFNVRLPKPLFVPFYFCLVNAACLVAVFNLLVGKKIVQWQPQRSTNAVKQPTESLGN